MPIRKVKGGYKWGGRGHTYPDRAGAERQAAAAYAHGYTGKAGVGWGYHTFHDYDEHNSGKRYWYHSVMHPKHGFVGAVVRHEQSGADAPRFEAQHALKPGGTEHATWPWPKTYHETRAGAARTIAGRHASGDPHFRAPESPMGTNVSRKPYSGQDPVSKAGIGWGYRTRSANAPGLHGVVSPEGKFVGGVGFTEGGGQGDTPQFAAIHGDPKPGALTSYHQTRTGAARTIAGRHASGDPSFRSEESRMGVRAARRRLDKIIMTPDSPPIEKATDPTGAIHPTSSPVAGARHAATLGYHMRRVGSAPSGFSIHAPTGEEIGATFSQHALGASKPGAVGVHTYKPFHSVTKHLDTHAAFSAVAHGHLKRMTMDKALITPDELLAMVGKAVDSALGKAGVGGGYRSTRAPRGEMLGSPRAHAVLDPRGQQVGTIKPIRGGERVGSAREPTTRRSVPTPQGADTPRFKAFHLTIRQPKPEESTRHRPSVRTEPTYSYHNTRAGAAQTIVGRHQSGDPHFRADESRMGMRAARRRLDKIIMTPEPLEETQ